MGRKGGDKGVTGPGHSSGWRQVGRGAGISGSHRFPLKALSGLQGAGNSPPWGNASLCRGGWARPALPLQRDTPRLAAQQPLGRGHGGGGGRILSAPDSVSPIGYKRMLLGWWQRTGRRADKTDHMGFDQHLWVPTNAWAPEVLVS